MRRVVRMHERQSIEKWHLVVLRHPQTPHRRHLRGELGHQLCDLPRDLILADGSVVREAHPHVGSGVEPYLDALLLCDPDERLNLLSHAVRAA